VEKHLEGPLRAAVRFLEERGFKYAIIGGVALPFWGLVRATRDIDIKVLVADTGYDSVRLGLREAFPQRARQRAPDNPLIVSVTIEGITVDFLLTLPGYEELIVSRAVQRDLNGWAAWICSAEDLIIQKVVAGRPKDWLDVENVLLVQRGQLDEAYIEEWLAQFAEVLDKPELLAEYKRLVAQAKDLDLSE